MPSSKKYIAHLDLDCFFVSVERIKDPKLIGNPVAVGGSATGRGVVSSASYEARKFGVHSAMPTARALKLCPHLIVVHGSHGEYGRISDKLFQRMCELAPLVERASIDEMNMDFTGCEHLYHNDLPGFMRTIKQLVLKEFQLPCTIGLAANKTVAKIATNRVKPNGVIFVPHGTEAAYLAPFDISVIPGIGNKTEMYLRGKGFNTVADIQRKSEDEILKILGKHGIWIYNAAYGRGSDTIGEEWSAKSISRDETFVKDISSKQELEKRLFELLEDVCSRVRKNGWKARTITLKLRYSDFKTTTHAESVEPTNDDTVVRNTIGKLLEESYSHKLAIRLIGVRLSNFEVEEQMTLFPTNQKKQDILRAVDGLREKFGSDIIHVGTT